MTPFPRLARGFKLAAAALMLGSLAACAATPFRADVSRFATRLPAPQGQSFAVVADDPSLAGGLEFSLYADYVDNAMRKLGYTQAATPEAATLLVRFDYGVDKGREKIQSRGGYYDPFYRPWYGFSPIGYGGYRGGFRGRGGFGYGGFGAWNYGWYDPFFGGFGGGGGVDSYTIYTSGIQLKIDDARTGARLFEGKAEAVSTSNRLQYLVPNLVEAMFTDFPGNSGETTRISIAPENQPVQKAPR